MRIEVKSDPEYFVKEKIGLKPNTVRKLDGKDVIVITNTQTGEKIERIITDISCYRDLIIFSFKRPILKEIPKELKKAVEKKLKVISKPMLKEKPKPKKKGRKPTVTEVKCIHCGSEEIVKRGSQISAGTKKQIYQCKKCNKKFIEPSKRKKEVKEKPQRRPDREEIIKFIKTREHTLEEIRKEFHFPTITSVYYWLAQAKVTASELPKISLEKDEDTDFSNPNEFSDS